MNTKTAFCEECRDYTEYTIFDTPMTGEIKGVEYHYIGKEIKCNNCGAFVFLPEINDYNLKALYDVYRVYNGIISLEKIREIPEKYAIGKRPLSLLLGWGNKLFPVTMMVMFLQNNTVRYLQKYTTNLNIMQKY